MKHLLFNLFLFLMLPATLFAQELTVKSFSLAEGDLTAQTKARKDSNNVNCAVVKVQLVGDIESVDGNVIKPLVKRGNETWVYMTQRSRQMQIKTKDYLPLMVTFSDYGIDRLESNMTYNLTILVNGKEPTQKLTIKCTPKNAVVIIDGDAIDMRNGFAKPTLSIGSHKYMATANGYYQTDGTIDLKADRPGKLTIELEAREDLDSVAGDIANDNTLAAKDNIASNSQIKETSTQYSNNQNLLTKVSDNAKYLKKARRLKRWAWIGGGTLMFGTAICGIAEIINEDDLGYGAMASLLGIASVATWAGCYFPAKHFQKKAKLSVQSAHLFQQGIKVGKNDRLMVGVDMLKDNTFKNQTLGLGLCYNF